MLGGNASSEILVPPVGAWAGVFRAKYPLDPRETGIVDEYRTAGNQQVKEGRSVLATVCCGWSSWNRISGCI